MVRWTCRNLALDFLRSALSRMGGRPKIVDLGSAGPASFFVNSAPGPIRWG